MIKGPAAHDPRETSTKLVWQRGIAEGSGCTTTHVVGQQTADKLDSDSLTANAGGKRSRRFGPFTGIKPASNRPMGPSRRPQKEMARSGSPTTVTTRLWAFDSAADRQRNTKARPAKAPRQATSTPGFGKSHGTLPTTRKAAEKFLARMKRSQPRRWRHLLRTGKMEHLAPKRVITGPAVQAGPNDHGLAYDFGCMTKNCGPTPGRTRLWVFCGRANGQTNPKFA